MTAYPDELGGLKCYRFPGLAAFPQVVHAFFTRQGGVSSAPYENLNLSFAVGDLPARVAENRRLVQQALGLNTLAGGMQVHGRREAVVTDGPTEAGEIPEVDILITRQPGLGLLIKQADCQAVMLYDPVQKVVANVHCGWRGQVQNVLGAAVTRLQESFACRPGDLMAAVGPSLGPCCAEFRNFSQEFSPHLWVYQVRPTYFDLWRLSRDQLAAAGLKPEHIEIAGLCTRCRGDEFFSYRREGITGRQGAIIALRSPY
jgi:YfiH family protein